MEIDLNKYKTPIFPNINDNPIIPTASKAGNGSDLIAKINGLIEELQITFDSLQNDIGGISTNSSGYFLSSEDVEKVEVYYLNQSEHFIYNSTVISLTVENHLYTYVKDVNYIPGELINFSTVIKENGTGYYFFLFVKTDSTYKDDIKISNINCLPKGAGRQFDQSLQISVLDNENNAKTAQKITPLVVSMEFGTINFDVKDNDF